MEYIYDRDELLKFINENYDASSVCVGIDFREN